MSRHKMIRAMEDAREGFCFAGTGVPSDDNTPAPRAIGAPADLKSRREPGKI